MKTGRVSEENKVLKMSKREKVMEYQGKDWR